jgi:hypothetical protein
MVNDQPGRRDQGAEEEVGCGLPVVELECRKEEI